jgi:hypothetical protein
MAKVTTIKDIISKMWRLKPTLNKNAYMGSNYSLHLSSAGSGKGHCVTYYYGEKSYV